LEEAEEATLGVEDERGRAAVERVAVGLHRTIEGEELLVLPKGVCVDPDALCITIAPHSLAVPLRLGKDHGTFTVRVGADGLRRLGTLATVLRRLLFTFRLHAGEDRLAVLFRQVGSTNADIDDIDAKTFPLIAYLVANLL